MSGTINLAFTQQFDAQGDPLSGGLLYFFTAGTTTPQSAFQDTGLTFIHPNPIVLDASGRVPMFYLADGFIKVRLTDKNGVTIIAADQLLVIGPSSGGGGSGGSAGDVTAALQTGDIKARYDTAVKDGFVRLNGLTIGNTGSSATERADPACQPLFEYLWPFPNILLQGFSKGASALADFGAGRQLILPDLRGRTIAGLDDMGNPAAASRLTALGLGVAGTTLGNAGGGETQTLATTQLPSHLHPLASQHFSGNLSIGSEDTGHVHSWGGTFGTAGVNSSLDHTHQYGSSALGGISGGGSAIGAGGSNTTSGSSLGGMDHTHNVTVGGNTGGESAAHAHAISGNTQPAGGGQAHANTQPTIVMTWYMKM